MKLFRLFSPVPSSFDVLSLGFPCNGVELLSLTAVPYNYIDRQALNQRQRQKSTASSQWQSSMG